MGINNNLICLMDLKSVKVAFGDSEAGRTRLYQTADVVLLLLNNGMKDAYGVCNSNLHAPEGTQKEYRFAVFAASYCKIFREYLSYNLMIKHGTIDTFFAFLGNGWLFSHEAGHCIGGDHLKPSSKHTNKTTLYQ